MILAVVPAAGKSVRMGRPKLSLPLGERTVLEWVVTALRRGGVEHVLVVVGPHVRELAPLAESAGADVLLLPEGTPDMRATVQHGLDWLERSYHPQENDTWLLVPADHPTLDAEVIQHLLNARRGHPEAGIVIPTYEGKRGHPAVIAWKHVASIRTLSEGQGLNAYLRLNTAVTVEVPVTSPHILCDLDTPEDYQLLKDAVTGERFLALASHWKDEARLLSSSTAIRLHPAYQAIIALGPPALPLILRDLEAEPAHWFEALKAISGEDPVPTSARGNIGAMRAAWLAWGRSHGLI